MPYGRYKRSGIYRKRYKRYRRTLSNKSIYNRTSAKSQANQIVALKKYIKRVDNRNKPEIKMLIHDPGQHEFTSTAFTSTTWGFWQNSPQNGTNDGQLIGNAFRTISLRLTGVLEFYQTAESQANSAIGAFMRIIVLQMKNVPLTQWTGGNYDAIQPGNILETIGTSGEDYDQSISSPFRTGSSSRFFVLCDRKYNLHNNRPQCLINISIRPKRRHHQYPTTTDGQTPTPTNWYYILFVTGGLKSAENSRLKVTCQTKYCFTDA